MRRQKVHQVDGHKCTLPIEEDLVSIYIHEGAFVNWRRKMRTFFMINTAYPETKAVFKSTVQIFWEKARHLRKYYCMLHPFSEGRACWETIMIVIYISIFMMLPLEIVMQDSGRIVKCGVVFLCAFCLLDIVFFFFTGYFDKRAFKVIMKPRRVITRYVFTYFLIDLVSSIPYNLYTVAATNYQYLEYFYFLKLLRLPTLLLYMRRYCVRLEMWSFSLKAFGFVSAVIIVIWWGTIYVFLIYITGTSEDEEIEENSDLTPLVSSCTQVVRTLGLISISNIQSEAVHSQLFYIILMFGGCVLNLVILTQILQIYRRFSETRSKYHTLLQEIGEYMNYKEQPLGTRERVLRYVGFKFQKNMFNENYILNSLSKSLQHEILIHKSKNLVEHVEFLKNLPDHIIHEIIKKLRSQICLNGDTIVQAGTVGNAMFFIHVGTVAVYSSTDKEICHLEDGNHFGEISLIIKAPRVASVIAITDCEVLRLSRKDFLEILEPYPSVYKKIKKAALVRLQSTNLFVQKTKSDMSGITVESDNYPGTPSNQSSFRNLGESL